MLKRGSFGDQGRREKLNVDFLQHEQVKNRKPAWNKTTDTRQRAGPAQATVSNRRLCDG